MFSIKSSFADCLGCSLFSEPSCILETNVKYLKDVEIIFIAENPGGNEVEKGYPLVGKAGKLFRKYFEMFGLNKINYLLTNVVLCQTLKEDGTTGNPTPETIERCKINCMKIIEECNPKLIVLMGSSPTSAFGLLPKGTGITNIRGQKFKWNEFNTFIMLHPSYINRIKGLEKTFEDDMREVSKLMGLSVQNTNSEKIKINTKKGVFYYKIPDKYYTSNYKLIDVQFLNKTNEILYIFRDKDNKKEYYKTNDDYICYQIQDESKARKVVKYENLNQIVVPYKNKYSLNPKITYEGDLKLTTKHAMDYYILKKEDEANVPVNVMFLDIETYTETKVHSSAQDVDDPITILRYSYKNIKKSLILDPKVLKINDQIVDTTNKEVIICNSEATLLNTFFNDVRNLECDYISGWYCLPKGSSLWLENEIIKIENSKINDQLFKYGEVLKKIDTGKQKSYILELEHGFEIEASKNHIFPVSIKDKKRFFTIKNFLDWQENKKVIDIEQSFKDGKEIYFSIERRQNHNIDYTYRNLLIDNIDKFLKFEYFDILLWDNVCLLDLKNNEKYRKEIENKKIFSKNYYWQGSHFYENHEFSYKKLRDYISKNDLIMLLKNNDIIHFIFKNTRIEIDISKVIDLEDLQLLGFMYTDGFWSKYDTNFHFDNKDVENSLFYMDIINRKYVRNIILNLENTWNKRDKLQSFYLLARTSFSILAMMVYNEKIKKEIDINILSKLSFNQFCAFFSGLVDGDGSCYRNHSVSICNFENNGSDAKKIHELVLWNGAFATMHSDKRTIFIPGFEQNSIFINNLCINESSRKKILDESDFYKYKNSCSNKCKKLVNEDILILRLKNITKSDIEKEMIDITTSSNYFVSGGIKTHNCNDFDLPYIINRSKKIGVDCTKMSKFGEADYNKYQFYPDAAGIVFLDMLELYKQFTFGGRESYSLDFISNLELKKGKTEKSSDFSELFRTDINRSILYNIRDVDLLEELDQKLKHIFFQDELKRICKNTYRGSKSVLGQIDSLLVSFLKEKGYSSKNSEPIDEIENFEGAYVQQPILGVHDYIVDFDFTSLYPSIILTYNIGVNTFVMKLKDYHLGYDLVYNPDKLPEQIDVIIDPIFENKLVTIETKKLLDKIKESDLTYTINGCFFKNHKTELSFYAEILEMLLGSRKLYKKKMFEAKNEKNAELEKLFDTRQLVMKTLANTLYGVLANKVFRFFNIDSARSITLSGQEAIKNVMINSENYIDSIKTKSKLELKTITKQQMFSDNMGLNFKNLVTGDTDSVFLTYSNIIDKTKPINEILEYVDKLNIEIQNFLNNDIVKKIVVEKHNVPIEKNRLDLKNELVIKRGLFLAKKRYAIYIISQEGNKTDSIKAMGLEIKRSDFSKTTKDYLNEVLNLILKSEKLSVPKVIEYVKEKESEFSKILLSRITKIGRPVSFSKKLKDYKTISQGVKSMLNWNDLEYKVFDVGSRGYLFKLKGIDLDKAPETIVKNFNEHFLKKGVKLETISVPEEVEYLPSYYILDVKDMLKFAWIDRYSLLLEPLLTKKQEILTF